MVAINQPATDVPAFTYAVTAPPLIDRLGSPTLGSVDEFERGFEGGRYARLFRAAARPRSDVGHVTKAVESLLRRVSAEMWGLPRLAGRFFKVTGGTCVDRGLPLYDQLLRSCVETSARPGGGDAAADPASGSICARPGEVLFVLSTWNRRTFLDAPALVVRVLRAHGLLDAVVGSAFEFESY